MGERSHLELQTVLLLVQKHTDILRYCHVIHITCFDLWFSMLRDYWRRVNGCTRHQIHSQTTRQGKRPGSTGDVGRAQSQEENGSGSGIIIMPGTDKSSDTAAASPSGFIPMATLPSGYERLLRGRNSYRLIYRRVHQIWRHIPVQAA